MNYLTEILGFMDWVMLQRPTTGQICLWYALMYLCNKTGWKERFTVSNMTLELLTGLSRRSIQRDRNALKQMGLIDFYPHGNKATGYSLNSVAVRMADLARQPSRQPSAQPSAPAATFVKPDEEKEKQTHSVPRQPLLMLAEYVSMTQQEQDSLKAEYGEQAVKEMVEILNNYKGSTGKEYRSDYLAVRSWVAARWRQDLQRLPPTLRQRAQDEESEMDFLYGWSLDGEKEEQSK